MCFETIFITSKVRLLTVKHINVDPFFNEIIDDFSTNILKSFPNNNDVSFIFKKTTVFV